MRIVVIGANGLLGRYVCADFSKAGHDVVPVGGPGSELSVQLDIRFLEQAELCLQGLKPDWLINCAAYTAVDRAESEQELAFAVNSIGPGNLARAAKKLGARMAHVSSDYVFGSYSDRQTPFRENELLRPCGIYGHSKRFGDELVLSELGNRALITRTSWLHAAGGPNFVDTIARVGAERDVLKVVNDQFGSPTWAPWLSETIVSLVANDASGVYHTSSRGDISWFDFAQEIIKVWGLTTKVEPQSSEELSRPAPRPRYSTLDVSKLEAFLGRDCPSWRWGLEQHFKKGRSE